ncbi:MAG: hypothetical protein LBV42_02270 [Methanobrevibacter sp.]|jgi:hypothetical protein|nr:hypothetical protein [Methanobrevibacter sp.]
MNLKTVKTIFKKEFKEDIDLKYMKKTLFILFFFPIIILIVGTSEYRGNELGNILSLFPIMLFYSFSIQPLQRKFFEVKMMNGFQPLLALPITLKEIWFGKILSIFASTYLLMIMAEVLSLIAGVIKFGTIVLTSFTLKMVFLMLLWCPMIISTIIIIISWIALRFKDIRTIDYLNMSIFIFIMAFVYSIPRFNSLLNGLDMNTLIIFVLLIAILIDMVFYYLISKIRKEML